MPTNDTECTCDVNGLTCHFGDSNNGDTFRCRHDEMDCSEPVECERTAGEYAEVCADVESDQLQLSFVRADEPENGPRCDAITCRERPDDDTSIVLGDAVGLLENIKKLCKRYDASTPAACTCAEKNGAKTKCKCTENSGLSCYYGGKVFECTHTNMTCKMVINITCTIDDKTVAVCMKKHKSDGIRVWIETPSDKQDSAECPEFTCFANAPNVPTNVAETIRGMCLFVAVY